MRVISGHLKGHKLKTIAGDGVRPTADKVKEALFSILAQQVQNARVLDLFAGSGALGIEAISRGAQSAVFIDHHSLVHRVLIQNLNHCKIYDRAEVIRWNIQNNLNCLKAYGKTFDLVLMDPPYGLGFVPVAIGHMLDVGCLAADATIVAEHEAGIRINLINDELFQSDIRKYGSNQLSFFKFKPDR